MVVSDRMTEANEQDQEQKRPLTLRSAGTLGLASVSSRPGAQLLTDARSRSPSSRRSASLAPGVRARADRPEPAPAVSRADPAGPAQAEPAPACHCSEELTEEDAPAGSEARKNARKLTKRPNTVRR